MADLMIARLPVSVSLDCDNCNTEICIDYEAFCEEHGCLCDWNYEDVICPVCGHHNPVDSWNID